MNDVAEQPSLAETIAPHLPFLRRYARALTGSQGSGDAYVAALLEALIADQALFVDADAPRLGLYKAFHAIYETACVEPSAEAVGGREAVARERLSSLAPSSRQALLLSAVEGFSHEDIAIIMECAPADVEPLIAEAVAELKRQTRARVLVIEDEPIIAMDIESIVTDLGHEVVAIADTRASAVEAAMEHRPDLVLADVQLADGSSGIDAVAEILGTFSVPVIFITAFPERLLTGARPEPTFLIAKPFQTATLEASVSQALFFRETEPTPG